MQGRPAHGLAQLEPVPPHHRAGAARRVDEVTTTVASNFVRTTITTASPVRTPGATPWIPRTGRPNNINELDPARTAVPVAFVLVRHQRARTAIAASPMNFSTVPPYESMMARAMSK